MRKNVATRCVLVAKLLCTSAYNIYQSMLITVQSIHQCGAVLKLVPRWHRSAAVFSRRLCRLHCSNHSRILQDTWIRTLRYWPIVTTSIIPLSDTCTQLLLHVTTTTVYYYYYCWLQLYTRVS